MQAILVVVVAVPPAPPVALVAPAPPSVPAPPSAGGRITMPVPPLPVPVPPLPVPVPPLPVPVPPLPLPLEPPLAPDPLDELPPVPVPTGELPPAPEVWLLEVEAFRQEVDKATTESAKSNRATLPPPDAVHCGCPGNLRRIFAPGERSRGAISSRTRFAGYRGRSRRSKTPSRRSWTGTSPARSSAC